MDSEGVSLSIHEHLMMPWNDMRRGYCCGRFESSTDGYYCKDCDIFLHKKCGDSIEYINHPYHSNHTLQLQRNLYVIICDLCGRDIENLSYQCEICDFCIDLCCARQPPPEVIDTAETHHHQLSLLKEKIEFDCDAKCGEAGDGYPYKCHKCDLAFHVDCVLHPSGVKHPAEVNHSHHSLHPLKLLTGQPPDYFDGKCCLCERKIDDIFYHCSNCNFSLDIRCVFNPPPKSLLHLKAHDHQLTLLLRHRSFTCNACGLSGDRSPYICVQCDFIIHQDCLALPCLININRHDHRIARTSVLGIVNSVCGVCRQKVDWTCGGYSCQKCPAYVVHSKCATREDVWNGEELEGLPEETEELEPYVEIDENTIHHFSHKEHYLRLNICGLLCKESKRCKACTHFICDQTFYDCMECDFILHKNCAEFPRRKWHVLHNERLTLVTREVDSFWCAACDRMSNGFMYQHGDKKLDVLCSSISEPFFHPSHPHHPLYYISTHKSGICNGCNEETLTPLLICIEDGCGFALDFTCATLPRVVKHRVDDHPLSLCFGEKAIGKYWCDICEEEINLKTWFYTCKDHRASLHTKCVLGDFAWLMPRSRIKIYGISCEVVLNNSISRPFCKKCESHCIPPIILKVFGTSDAYFCSIMCLYVHFY